MLNKELLADIDQILEEMTYIQFAEVDDFLEQMVAAQALPHTDYKKYPTVMEKLKKRQNICFYSSEAEKSVMVSIFQISQKTEQRRRQDQK